MYPPPSRPASLYVRVVWDRPRTHADRQKIRSKYDHITDPLLAAIKKELASIVSRLHRLDLEKAVDPMSGISGTSLYMKDLVDKLNFVKTGLLSNFAPEIAQPWFASCLTRDALAEFLFDRVPEIVKYVIRTFVLHSSIAKPLGESGKLQLATDMAELEFSLNAFLADASQGKRGGNLEHIGEEYKALRAMRFVVSVLPAHVVNDAVDRSCFSRMDRWRCLSALRGSRRSSCSIIFSFGRHCHFHTHFTGGRKQSMYAGSMSILRRRRCR